MEGGREGVREGGREGRKEANGRMFLRISIKSEQNLLSWSTCHYCGRCALVAPVSACRGQ